MTLRGLTDADTDSEAAPTDGGGALKVSIVHARRHMPDVYSDYFKGHRAVRLLDEQGRIRAELVWRFSSGPLVEVTECGVFDSRDRRKGLGSRLLKLALVDMRRYFERAGKPLTRVYAFCEAGNAAGRAFYESRGFELKGVIEGFYPDCDAALYCLRLT